MGRVWDGNEVCPGASFGYKGGRMFKTVIGPLIEWYQGALATGGYWLVGLLMAIESSILPVPSEAVIPPAALIAGYGPAPLSTRAGAP